MSKNSYRSSITHTVSYIINEINNLSDDEIKRLYGIDLLEDGKVFDPTYNREFLSVGEWAVFSAEQDAVEYEEHFYGKEYEEG